jgi:hypothetical protein
MRNARRQWESLTGFLVGAMVGALPLLTFHALLAYFALPEQALPRDLVILSTGAGVVTPLVAGCVVAAVQLYTYERGVPPVIRRLFKAAVVTTLLGLVFFILFYGMTVREVGYVGGELRIPWVVGFGDRLPTCDCGTLSDEGCIQELATPESVAGCWGSSAIRYGKAALLFSYLSVVIGISGMLGLAIGVALARRRVLQGTSRELTGPVLQKLINAKNDYVDPVQFRQKLATLERQVCLIEINGRPKGTGFLIGPNLVLTNHHVVKLLLEEGGPPREELRLLFDYVQQPDRSVPRPRESRLADPWLIDSSKHSDVDLVSPPKPRDPELDELDHAVLCLEDRPGDDLLDPGGTCRGYMDLTRIHSVNFVEGSPMLILQHPRGQPLQLAFDTDAILKTNTNRTRVWYRTNTESGSSGSPCFDSSLQLVALHHSGDLRCSFNEGIPIDLISQRLIKRGILTCSPGSPIPASAQKSSTGSR